MIFAIRTRPRSIRRSNSCRAGGRPERPQEWGSNREPWCLDRSLLGQTHIELPINFRHAFGCNGLQCVLASLMGMGTLATAQDQIVGIGLAGPSATVAGFLCRFVVIDRDGPEVEVIGLGVTPDGDVLHTHNVWASHRPRMWRFRSWLCRHLMPPR